MVVRLLSFRLIVVRLLVLLIRVCLILCLRGVRRRWRRLLRLSLSVIRQRSVFVRVVRLLGSVWVIVRVG